MHTLRNIIESLKNEVDYIKDENPDVDFGAVEKEIDNIIDKVDELESNNTDASNVIDDIDGTNYLQDLVNDLREPIGTNAKILY